MLTNADDYAAFLVDVFCKGAAMDIEQRGEMLREANPDGGGQVTYEEFVKVMTAE